MNIVLNNELRTCALSNSGTEAVNSLIGDDLIDFITDTVLEIKEQNEHQSE